VQAVNPLRHRRAIEFQRKFLIDLFDARGSRFRAIVTMARLNPTAEAVCSSGAIILKVSEPLRGDFGRPGGLLDVLTHCGGSDESNSSHWNA
jgi:hypothetical protein